MSFTCPGCTSPIFFKDLIVDQSVQGNVDTLGHIHISPSSRMTGEVACGQFTNSGKFKGTAIVHGAIALSRRSETSGELKGISLEVEKGAKLEGKACIGPVVTQNDNPDTSPDSPPLASPIKRPKIRVRPEKSF